MATNLLNPPESKILEASAPNRTILIYLISGFAALALGMGNVPALVTTFREQYGLSGVETANIHNAKDGGAIVAMLAGAFVLRWLGPHRTILGALALAGVGCGVFLVVPSYVGILTGAALHGAAFSLGAVAIFTALFKLPEQFRLLAVLTASFGLASLAAPGLVGLLVSADGYDHVYWVLAGLLTFLVVFGLALEAAPGRAPEDAKSRAAFPRGQFRSWLPGVLIYAAIMAGETIVISWVAALAQWRYGATLAEASALLVTLWAIHTPVRALGDVLARRFTSQLVVTWGLLVAALGAGVVCGGSMLWAYVGAVVFAVGMGSLVPVWQGRVLSLTPTEHHGPLNSALALGSALIVTVTVAATGVLVDIDPRLPFAAAAGLMVFVAVWVVRNRKAAQQLVP